MPKKEKNKKQNISINTGEPIEEKEIELIPGLVEDAEDKEDDDDLALDDEEVDPFGDKWEQ